MDPFTQRMLERARARQEKIDQKLASSGQVVTKRKPLSENVDFLRTEGSPVKSPSKVVKEAVSPRKTCQRSSIPVKSPGRKSVQKPEQNGSPSSQKCRSDVVVTKKEFKSPRNSVTRRNSDVSVEINIMHRDDIQIEVQVEEREVPVNVTYDTNTASVSSVIVEEIEEDTSKQSQRKAIEMADQRSERPAIRNNIKSRLDRLGNLYSDSPNLSSPIHRTEQEFTSETPPPADTPREVKPAQKEGKRKFGRLAALADQINNWEDDLTHHSYQSETTKKTQSKQEKQIQEKQSDKHDSSTLDVSIHSVKDINRVLDSTGKSKQSSKKIDSTTFKKPTTNECQKLDNKIVAQLEGEGYRRVSASQSRLVYDFSATRPDRVRQEPSGASTTLSATAAPKMATMVAGGQPVNTATVTKKPSIKKYKAPTPPQRVSTDEDKCESDIDKENNIVVDREENDNENECCVQTKPDPAEKPLPEKDSPAPFRRFAPKLNSNTNDRSSVLSKAAMFEAGSPKAKDPAEMSLRERKALFEKNKGVAIVPKAPFGQAPSVKTLHGDNKADNKPTRPVTVHAKTTPTKQNTASANSSRTNSKENIPDDATSQSSLGGGIKGKLAALFSKEQTISETTIANKFKLEREREMDMLQNRFHSKPKQNDDRPDSDDDQSEHDPSEKAPLMGSTISLSQVMRKPEVIANIPKLARDDKAKSQISLEADVHLGRNEQDRVIGAQPVKRRSSQDSPVVLSVLEDVKRIKVNNSKKEAESNGAVTDQPRLYPHLSDIETDHSNQEEYSECGGSSAGNITDKLNKSDDWADTSFGREVMNVVKKNNTSYKKAVRESSDSEQSACDSELDDMLDEALKEEGDGPTPPKLNKQGSLSSSSFVYSGAQERAAAASQFKSPLKAQPPPAPATPATPRDRGAELVHTVSFYRRAQSASSTPSTPMRVIRHASPDRESDAESEAAAAAAAAAAGVTTVRQRIKELQAEIAEQQTVISQASQALNLCASTIEFSGSTEQAEGERLLLLATHRRQACLHEMQRLQVEGAGVASAAGMAALGVHALSVPLRRDYVRQLNADGAVGHHALLLIKCRDRVLATSMQRTLPPAPALTFPDEIRMDGLSSDFKVTVEVYLLQASKENLPHDVKYHISNKKSSSKLLTPKSKVSELKAPRVQSPAGPLAVRSPQFALHGYCIFALPQASRKTFTLNKVPAGSPLEGSLCMDIRARVRVPAPPAHAAFLTAFDDVSGLGAWHRRWFRLQAPRLAYWKYPDDVHKKMPIGDIDLSSVLSPCAVRAPRDLCARPNTILLETAPPAGLPAPDGGSLVYATRPDGAVVRRHLLAADTPKDRDMWIECINRALEYVRCCGNDDE